MDDPFVTSSGSQPLVSKWANVPKETPTTPAKDVKSDKSEPSTGLSGSKSVSTPKTSAPPARNSPNKNIPEKNTSEHDVGTGSRWTKQFPKQLPKQSPKQEKKPEKKKRAENTPERFRAPRSPKGLDLGDQLRMYQKREDQKDDKRSTPRKWKPKSPGRSEASIEDQRPASSPKFQNTIEVENRPTTAPDFRTWDFDPNESWADQEEEYWASQA